MRNDELKHYGVLGMKWGVRRYQDYGEGGYNPKHKGKFNPAKTIKNKMDKYPGSRKNIKKMSDEDLDYNIRRLQKEHQYRDLLLDDIDVGGKIAKGVALGTATIGAAVAAKSIASKLDPKFAKNGKSIAAAALATFGAVTIDAFADKMGKAATAKTIKDAFGGDVFKATYPKK